MEDVCEFIFFCFFGGGGGGVCVEVEVCGIGGRGGMVGPQGCWRRCLVGTVCVDMGRACLSVLCMRVGKALCTLCVCVCNSMRV